MYYLYLDNELIAESDLLYEIAEIIIVEILNNSLDFHRTVVFLLMFGRDLLRSNYFEWSIQGSEVRVYYGKRQ